MDKQELKSELAALGVTLARYSLIGEKRLDAIVLQHNGHHWDVAYVDERGGEELIMRLTSEEAALKYIFKLFKEDASIRAQFNLRNE